MKLSDAILLGDSLKKPDHGSFLDNNGACGCALGGALLAAGSTWEDFLSHPIQELLNLHWPWMTEEHRMQVGVRYSLACTNRGTLEDVIAYAKSIEPPEYVPDYRDEQGITDAPAELELHRNR